MDLFEHQIDAVKRMKNGCILNGSVGSGKSRTALAYYYKECGGDLYSKDYKFMDRPKDLYIITTARKRDTLEWEGELGVFLLSTNKDVNYYNNTVVVDSWNNIKKYSKIYGSFFIFDEDRVTGSGVWVKTFLKIARCNRWIILSATPGDTWSDYIPVFIANNFYKNKTQFTTEHVVYSRYSKYPKIDRYINTKKLMEYRDSILINMDFKKDTIRKHEYLYCSYDVLRYKNAIKNRWNDITDKPFKNAGELCLYLRKMVNSDDSRQYQVLRLLDEHPKVIIFYNFDYELEILKNLGYSEDTKVAEWNGHAHQVIPSGNRWVYLVQYTAGCEGWNCIETDTIIFYSQNYSYKTLEQACGRIDRLNTPFKTLYYYHLTSWSSIDISIKKAINSKKMFNESKFVKFD